jgi:hypothetical protein
MLEVMRKGWTTVANLVFFCQRKDGRTLLVNLQPEPGMLDAWKILAIETVGGRQVTLDDILEDHAHADLGPALVGLTTAMETAERYAKRWQRKSVAIDPCACEDIAKTG